MSLNTEHENSEMSPEGEQHPALTIPKHTLMVLCGPAGSGKSTFARTFVEAHQEQGITATAIVSSDTCRALVCDDEAMQDVDTLQQRQIQQHTFELFYSILAKRLALGRLSVADALALHDNVRTALLEMAHKFNAFSCLIVFHTSLPTCLAQNQQQRRTHLIPEPMIASQVHQLQHVLLRLPHEGWDQIHILNERHRELELSIALS